MKKLFITILIFLVSISFVQGQNVPPGIAYQAVAIKDGPHSLGGQNASSFNWSNKDIQVRFTIFEKYPGGSNQYTEVHKTKTDEYGVFNLIIGQGQSISGVFNNIQWDLGTAHLQVEIDFENNNTFKLTSLERFWSVPYAFNTRNSKGGGMNNDSALNSLNNKFNYLKNRDNDTVIGNEVSYKSLDSLNQILKAQLAKFKASDKDTVVGNEWQKLVRIKDTLILSDEGGKVTLMDEDPENELQKIKLTNDTLILSKNGGSIVLSDVVSKYGYKPSLQSKINNVSTNSLCFYGTLVNLETWSAQNNYNVISPHGTIVDSFFIFTAFNSTTSNGAVYLHDIKSNIISKIFNGRPYRVFTGDSMLYIIEDNAFSTTIVKKISTNKTLDSISTFINGPAINNFDKPVINKSGELVWIYSSNGTQGDIYKFNLKTKNVSNYTNIQNGKSYGGCKRVNGDTFILGTRLVNTKNMSLIIDFTFLQNSDDKTFACYNSKIYYSIPQVPNSSTIVIKYYDLQRNLNTQLGFGAVQFLGVNNNELWLSLVPSCGSSNYTKIGNLGISCASPSILSILPNGMIVNHGFSDATLFSTAMVKDNNNAMTGAFYNLGNNSYNHCVNGSLPNWTFGYFYSN
jgi:hypothetical protein